jgi:threonine dehydratase
LFTLTLSTIAPQVKIYGAEPRQADDAARSLHAGRLITDDAPQTVADGLKVPMKELTWQFVRQYVADILTVDEQAIIDAMKLVWQRMKIVIEPSCAVPVAAILANPSLFAGQRIGVIITGGNVDLDRLPWLNQEG